MTKLSSFARSESLAIAFHDPYLSMGSHRLPSVFTNISGVVSSIKIRRLLDFASRESVGRPVNLKAKVSPIHVWTSSYKFAHLCSLTST